MKYKYYKTKYKRLSANDVFVYIPESSGTWGNMTCYCPIGQHSAIDPRYLEGCKEISKETYLKASGGLYTPKEYLK